MKVLSDFTNCFSSIFNNFVKAFTKLLKIDEKQFVKSLSTFKGLPHRYEIFLKRKNCTFINDSKATNVEATEAALNGVSGPQIVLLGGAGKNGADYAQLLPLLTEKARHVICFGQSGQELSLIHI